MRLFVCCTPQLLTSLNQIIGVLHPKPPHQSQWDYYGAVPQNSSQVSQTSSPVSMGLLVCCTPNLLTSLNMRILGRSPQHLHTCLKPNTALQPHKHSKQSQSQYSYPA